MSLCLPWYIRAFDERLWNALSQWMNHLKFISIRNSSHCGRPCKQSLCFTTLDFCTFFFWSGCPFSGKGTQLQKKGWNHKVYVRKQSRFHMFPPSQLVFSLPSVLKIERECLTVWWKALTWGILAYLPPEPSHLAQDLAWLFGSLGFPPHVPGL